MSTSIPNIYQKLLDSFPFLSFCTHGNNEYIGIIQNMDNVLCSMYIYENIQNDVGKKLFLELGDEWWCEIIPNDIYSTGTSKDSSVVTISGSLWIFRKNLWWWERRAPKFRVLLVW